jgi:SPP1 family predicted phage head-tail adaptor
MTKCCDISAGQMRSLIVIERTATVSDGEGGLVDGWVADPVGGVYARMRASGGGEHWQSMRVTPGNRFRAVIRYRDNGSGAPYYTIGDRVVYKGRTYGIDSVVDVEDRRKYLEMVLVENAAT